MKSLLKYCLLFVACAGFSQNLTLGDYLKRIGPSAASMAVAGGFNSVMDNVADRANYRNTIFEEKWPISEFKYGQYIGPKDETWVNKWAMDSSGEIVVGYDAYFLSSTALVGTTDLWHGAQSGMLFGIKGAILLYEKPDKWWVYLLDFVTLSAAWSAGFTLTGWIIRTD